MEIKEVAPFTVISHSIRTTLATIMEDAGNLPELIAKDAEKEGLKITGPNMWIYDGADGDPKKEYTLEIAYPIASAEGYDGKYACRELPAYLCLSGLHLGSFESIEQTYKELAEEAGRHGYIPNGWSRETYFNWVDNYSLENKAEIQLGIVAVPKEEQTV